MSSEAVRDWARTWKDQVSWPVLLPYHDTQGVDPEPEPNQTSWSGLDFEAEAATPTCIGTDVPYRESGTVTVQMFGEVGNGDGVIANAAGVHAAVFEAPRPLGLNVTEIGPPVAVAPGGVGNWFRADVRIGYEYDFVP